MFRLSAFSSLSSNRAMVLCVLVMLTATAHARTRPHYGGTIRIEVEGDPLQKPDGIAWRLMLDGLTRKDSEGAVRPSLATRWTSEDNDHRWQFWLRPGVSFHNGHPLNALAVVTSLEESCRAAACPWSAVRVLGQSVVFTSDNPIPDLPSLLSENGFLIQQKSLAEDNAAATVIGTGPFRMKDSNNSAVQLEANDDCWQGRPFVDAIEIEAHRPTRDQWMDLSLGKADVAEVRPSDIRQARQQRLNVIISPEVALLALEVHNTELTPQLRAALALSVDRAALYQFIFQKQAEVTASLLPDSLSGYSFLFPIDRDLTRAQSLRGGITPPPLALAYDGTGPIQLAAERLALNLHDAGFAVRVIPPGPNGYISPRTDLILRPFPLTGGTPSDILDELLRRFGQTAPAKLPDAAATYKSEHDFLDQHTVIPLLDLPRAWAVSGRMRDLRLTAEGVPDLANVSLEDAK
ncbi:ABC transporter substrate-binding protein [Acidicapsa acidisoli]|uniref:ABC transporter substrate-binding protein n=1 Tax=Acidicapsa acidisoli TaxID=1615681 RepID=UPI0021DFEAD5|nr:ABC transporter substrate-binding protein [Acidicapsa acidisoli]